MNILKGLSAGLFFCYLFFGASLTAQETATEMDAQLTVSQLATKEWINLVDQGRYGDSWDAASVLMKITVSRREWERILTVTRKPLGSVINRTLAEQRPAQNPKGLPAGDYMVILYNTTFSGKSGAKELVTLYLENNQWKVVTYLVN